jgi:hypothetical protein
MDVNCERVMNVQIRVNILRTFVTYLLVHMLQKKKIALQKSQQKLQVGLNTNPTSNPCDYHFGIITKGPVSYGGGWHPATTFFRSKLL